MISDMFEVMCVGALMGFFITASIHLIGYVVSNIVKIFK